MKGRKLSPQLLALVASYNYTPTQQAAFDNLPWDLEHTVQDVTEAAEAISRVTDEQAMELANEPGVIEVLDLLGETKLAVNSVDDPLGGIFDLLDEDEQEDQRNAA